MLALSEFNQSSLNSTNYSQPADSILLFVKEQLEFNKKNINFNELKIKNELTQMIEFSFSKRRPLSDYAIENLTEKIIEYLSNLASLIERYQS